VKRCLSLACFPLDRGGIPAAAIKDLIERHTRTSPEIHVKSKQKKMFALVTTVNPTVRYFVRGNGYLWLSMLFRRFDLLKVWMDLLGFEDMVQNFLLHEVPPAGSQSDFKHVLLFYEILTAGREPRDNQDIWLQRYRDDVLAEQFFPTVTSRLALLIAVYKHTKAFLKTHISYDFTTASGYVVSKGVHADWIKRPPLQDKGLNIYSSSRLSHDKMLRFLVSCTQRGRFNDSHVLLQLLEDPTFLPRMTPTYTTMTYRIVEHFALEDAKLLTDRLQRLRREAQNLRGPSERKRKRSPLKRDD